MDSLVITMANGDNNLSVGKFLVKKKQIAAGIFIYITAGVNVRDLQTTSLPSVLMETSR